MRFGLSIVMALGACASAAKPVDPATLHTSCGRLQARADGSFEVSDACFRAVAPGTGRAARLAFTYLGPSTQAEALASGELRRQVGLKLRAQDTCNVISVMWHVAPDARIEVSVKQNAGQSEHAQCRDAGYSFIRPTHEVPVAPIAVGTQHVLAARLDAAALSVEADGQLVWQGQLPSTALALQGPFGLRTDNAHALMQLQVTQ
jgi:hypothetical protein